MMRMILILLVIILAGFAAYRYWIADTGPKHFHAWLGEPMLDLVAQWPEKLDRQLEKPPHNRWSTNDAITIAGYSFGFTLDIPDAPIEIPATQLVFAGTNGGKIISIATGLSEDAQPKEEAIQTANWALKQLEIRGLREDNNNASFETITTEMLAWFNGPHPHDKDDKWLWNFRRADGLSATLTMRYFPDISQYAVFLEFRNYSLDDRVDVIVKAMGKDGFYKLDDPEAFFPQ